MKILIIIGLLALASCNSHKPIITREHLKELKTRAEFETYDYETHPFKDANEHNIKAALGLRGMGLHQLPPVPKGFTDDLPTNFVAHDKWPQCIHQIRDQQRCGSCWAFAASEVLSDRFCIASSGKVDQILSPQDMVSCDKNDFGCNGGYLDKSWNYLAETGIVTDECYPYTSGKGDSGRCLINNGKCVDGKTDVAKYHAKNVRGFKSIEEIKKEIFANGPIETGFLVYQDFISYKGGIYKKSSEVLLGGHAVKVVGWGNETGTDYWVVANSWGPKWGESGHFRIAINNCCNFDSQMITGDADLEHSPDH
jgi:cathepsin B